MTRDDVAVEAAGKLPLGRMMYVIFLCGNRLTMDRLILFFFTESVWPSSAVPSHRQ